MLKGTYILKLGNEGEFGERAADVLKVCLTRVPFISIASMPWQTKAGNMRPDRLFRVTNINSKEETVLVIAIKNSGQPRFARDAFNALSRFQIPYKNSYGVFIAPYVADEAAGMCKSEGVGYIDFAGNCRLAFDGVFIEQSGKQNPFTQKRDLRKLFSVKAERVLRVLLNNPNKAWRMLEVASEARVSTGEVFNVKKALSDREWITSDATGFRLNKWGILLSTWTDNYSYRQNEIKEYYSLKSIPDLEAELAAICTGLSVKYALTGFSAAARIAPMVKYSKATAYIDTQPDIIAGAMNLKEAPAGANISLCIPYDKEVFYNARLIDGTNTVSPVQLYLDLKSNPGRGEEAAEILLNDVIRTAWSQNGTIPQKL